MQEALDQMADCMRAFQDEYRSLSEKVKGAAIKNGLTLPQKIRRITEKMKVATTKTKDETR